MSRGFILGVLSTVFVVGGAAGYFARGARDAEAPTLARATDGSAPLPAPFPESKSTPSSRPTGLLKATPTPGAYYRLAEKETLSDVAKRAYGTTKRLNELVLANPTLDAKRLQPGTLIFVPAGIEPIPVPPERPSTPGPAMTATKPATPEAPPVFAKPK